MALSIAIGLEKGEWLTKATLPYAAAAIAAKQNYTDHDIVNFLTNVECLEGQFDTWGAFGFGFIGKQIQTRAPTAHGSAELTVRISGMQEVTVLCCSDMSLCLKCAPVYASLPHLFILPALRLQ